jgi:hypothetical protein
MLLKPRAGNEEEDEDDYQTLLRLGENKNTKKAFHDFA